MTAIIVCLYSADEYELCITWTPFQIGQICFEAVCMCVCTCVFLSFIWQGKPCRQLKVLINALLDNTPANPIIWQALIRAFASLTACLSGSLQGADTLSADCCKGEEERTMQWLTNILLEVWSVQLKGSCG